MRYRELLHRQRADRKRYRARPRRPHLSLDLGDGLEVFLISTRNFDLLVCHHRYSGRVHFTRLLPGGVWAEISWEQRTEMAMSFLKRPVADQKATEQGVALPSDIRLNWPALGEYLYAEKYPDGQPRARATLTLMAGDASGWKMVLNDRQEGRSLWATGDTLEEALLALETALQADHTPWRADRSNGKAMTKK